MESMKKSFSNELALTNEQAAIVTNRHYSEEATRIAVKVAEATRIRHTKWLVNRQFVLDQSHVDASLSEQARYCESVIHDERERVTRNQRLLLECERARVKDKQRQQEIRQQIHAGVVDDILSTTENAMKEQLLVMSPVQLFGRFPDFSYFASTAYSPSLSVSKLSVLTTNDSSLSSEVLSLMGNAKFLERIKRRPMALHDAKVAIGALGLENCVRLFPILMSKPLLKWQEPTTKNIAPKLWQQMMVTANATCQRLRVAGWSTPEQGLLLGVLLSLGTFAVANQYPRFFEEALISRMQQYREANERDKYYACADVTLDLSRLPRLLATLSDSVTKHIIEALPWTLATQPIKVALEEELNKVPVLERSLFGVALAQGNAFSIYDALESSRVFVDKHKPFWFANVQLSAKDLSKLSHAQLGRLELLS
ncbi:HDOD domain-containing protein [Vibrio cidicii]|uniref:HDOD domain-containing protein n=1 Tax=Vibrio cidicii TaxID=1763883 RepID=UPI0037037495